MVIDSQLAPCQQSYRITLDLTVDEDFNPRQIDFRRVLICQIMRVLILI